MSRSFAEVRRVVTAQRRQLADLAARRTQAPTLAAGGVIVPEPIVGPPVPLTSVALRVAPSAPEPDWAAMRAAAADLFEVAGPTVGFARALAAAEPTRRLWDGATYRLVDAARSDVGLSLAFVEGSYFGLLDSCEVLAHELAARPDHTPLRDLHRDPFDFGTRSAALAVSAITIVVRPEGPRFFLIRRSPSVALAPGMVHIVPAGEFQPRSAGPAFDPRDFDVVAALDRELLEELAAVAEDASDRPALRACLADGTARGWTWGVVVDPLILRPELIAALVFDGDAFDAAVGPVVADGPEGVVLGGPDGRGMPFDAETIAGFTAPEAPVVSFAAAALHLAWRDRDRLLSR